MSNNRGFSLLEVLLYLIVFGIMSSAFASLLSNSFTMFERANNKTELLNAQFEIAFHYRDAVQCANDFSGIKLDVGNIGTAASQQDVDFKTHLSYLKSYKAKNLEPDAAGITLKEAQSKYYMGSFKVLFQKSDGKGLSMRPIDIPIIYEIDPATNEIVRCISGTDMASASELAKTDEDNPIYGTCRDGYVMKGLDADGIICVAAQEEVVIPPSKGNEAPYSSTNPGPGCTGDGCITNDYGPCRGNGCITNGSYCQGNGCIAQGRGT